MINIRVNDEMFAYDMFHIIKAFLPGVAIEQKVHKECSQVVSILFEDSSEPEKHFVIEGTEIQEITDRKLKKRYVNHKVYQWLQEVTGRELAWGIMTGVRPTKPMMELIEQGKSDKETIHWMQENYRVTEAKAKLGLEVARKKKQLLNQ
jgi:oxygen-independent coproporphyrinogen-3 oxidase